MQNIAVIGGGIIGSAWAITFARAGRAVALYEPDLTARAQVIQRLREQIESSALMLDAADTEDTVMGRITLSATLSEAVVHADYVQECIPELLDMKIQLFSTLEQLCRPAAILASSSSSFGMSQIADTLATRARCVIAHPATPPHLLPVVEVAPAKWTAAETLNDTFALMRSVGQTPVLIKKEVAGFVLNRLQGALLNEMLTLIDGDVISPIDADKLISHGLGLRWALLGPLAGVDLNAPGGIRDYLTRYGFIFNDLARERGGKPIATAALAQQLGDAMREQTPLEALGDKAKWRDAALSSLRHHLHNTTTTECRNEVHHID